MVAIGSPRGNAVDQSTARLGWDDTREGRQQRRLADARGPDDCEGRSGAQRQRNTRCERWSARPTDGEIACLDDGGSLRDVVGLRRCVLVEERTDARRGLGAAHELGGGGRQLGDSLECG